MGWKKENLSPQGALLEPCLSLESQTTAMLPSSRWAAVGMGGLSQQGSGVLLWLKMALTHTHTKKRKKKQKEKPTKNDVCKTVCEPVVPVGGVSCQGYRRFRFLPSLCHCRCCKCEFTLAIRWSLLIRKSGIKHFWIKPDQSSRRVKKTRLKRAFFPPAFKIGLTNHDLQFKWSWTLPVLFNFSLYLIL